MSRRRSPQPRATHRRAFTLIEILVTISIILISTLVAIPVLSSLNGRQVVDAAQIVQGALAGARDAAIKDNTARGVRLIPDPLLTIPAPGQAGAGSLQLCYRRMVAIEPAPDYGVGKINIGPQLPPGVSQTGFPPPHPISQSSQYPFPSSGVATQVLMVEESPFVHGFVVGPTGSPAIPNEPVNWWWNVRLGDKIRIGGTGRAYTVVGPCTINPWVTGANQGNPDLFVNIGQPGKPSPLVRSYYDSSGNRLTTAQPEFLFVVNGEDDDDDGYIDQGWDGYDQNNSGMPDDILEWTETEEWKSAQIAGTIQDKNPGPNSPSVAWAVANLQNGFQDTAYSISRRPVPSPSARETSLPAGTVIDATSWGVTNERSRLPIQPGSLYVDLLLSPTGLLIPSTIYSAPTANSPVPFVDFWVCEQTDVHPIGSVWGTGTGGPNPNPNAGQSYLLPMPDDAAVNDPNHVGYQFAGPGNYPPGGNTSVPVLKGDRRLVTLFGKTGMVAINTLDTVPHLWDPSVSALNQIRVAGEGFNVNDVNQPFYKPHLGLREVR